MKKYQYNVMKWNLEKYNSTPLNYQKFQILLLMENANTHLVSIFKDYLLFDDMTEFIKEFYYSKEIYPRLKQIYDYYESSSYLFPNYTSINEGKYIYRNIIKKQKLIDYLEDLEDKKKEKEEKKLKKKRNNQNKNEQSNSSSEFIEVFNTKIYDNIRKETWNDSKINDLFCIDNKNNNESDSFASIIKLTDMIKEKDKIKIDINKVHNLLNNKEINKENKNENKKEIKDPIINNNSNISKEINDNNINKDNLITKENNSNNNKSGIDTKIYVSRRININHSTNNKKFRKKPETNLNINNFINNNYNTNTNIGKNINLNNNSKKISLNSSNKKKLNTDPSKSNDFVRNSQNNIEQKNNIKNTYRKNNIIINIINNNKNNNYNTNNNYFPNYSNNTKENTNQENNVNNFVINNNYFPNYTNIYEGNNININLTNNENINKTVLSTKKNQNKINTNIKNLKPNNKSIMNSQISSKGLSVKKTINNYSNNNNNGKNKIKKTKKEIKSKILSFRFTTDILSTDTNLMRNLTERIKKQSQSNSIKKGKEHSKIKNVLSPKRNFKKRTKTEITGEKNDLFIFGQQNEINVYNKSINRQILKNISLTNASKPKKEISLVNKKIINSHFNLNTNNSYNSKTKIKNKYIKHSSTNSQNLTSIGLINKMAPLHIKDIIQKKAAVFSVNKTERTSRNHSKDKMNKMNKTTTKSNNKNSFSPKKSQELIYNKIHKVQSKNNNAIICSFLKNVKSSNKIKNLKIKRKSNNNNFQRENNNSYKKDIINKFK